MKRATDPADAQRVYAVALVWGTRIGLGLLMLCFAAYATGLIPPHVPIEDLPRLWSRPASELLAATGTSPGWGWGALLPSGDMLVLAAIAFLASCSIACLLLALFVFRSGGERAFATICALQVLVLVLAASGVLSGGH